jgi:hypothetical protein
MINLVRNQDSGCKVGDRVGLRLQVISGWCSLPAPRSASSQHGQPHLILAPCIAHHDSGFRRHGASRLLTFPRFAWQIELIRDP